MKPTPDRIKKALADFRDLYRAGNLSPELVEVATWLAEPEAPNEAPSEAPAPMKEDGCICPTCGAKMVEYTFTFNAALATFLRRLFEVGVPARTDDLGLTYSQRTNSQKLRYWDLAAPYINEESKRKAGWWVITDAGRAFVRGESRIFRKVVMYRNARVRFEGEQIYIQEVCDGYEYRADYQEQIRKQSEAADEEGV